ncbi:MAG TPA: S-layer family protein, partial [Oscillatoriales cyanobacterium M59_W2019_021]|nr:S-layer family protein [Oscillatoriales cyanobacterium M59_W2019_021]
GASLFLLNPNGIVFGPNARLDIGGSFLGSTADSVVFQDGSVFSATEANAPPLLTISVPIGLQFNENSGTIRAIGSGYTLERDENFAFAVHSDANLRVSPGNTLALLGGEVSVEGGRIGTVAGHLELGSVMDGSASLIPGSGGWTFGYDLASSLGNVRIARGLVEAIAPGGGSIQVRGRQVSLTDGGLILIQNQSPTPSGGIVIRATELLESIGQDPTQPMTFGVSPIRRTGSGIVTQALLGSVGNIDISTQSLVLTGGRGIISIGFNAPASHIVARASQSISLQPNPNNLQEPTLLGSFTFGSGKTGDITVSTENLTILGGSSFAATTLGSGDSGDVRIDAQSIEVVGISEDLVTSGISAGTVNQGNAGDVTINTGRLVVRDGGRVDSSSVAAGNAGSVTVNASELVEISGTVPGSINPSLLISSANLLDESLRELLGLPPLPSGASGNLTVNTPQLRVSDGALVNVGNDGTGDGGRLSINADSIILNDRGGIAASTQSGEGGNISLHVTDLQLRNGGQITAEAGGTGNGGNITLNTKTIALLENSRITANATEGAGGNIQITTQGLFASGDSPITASSQFGVNGNITITNPEVDPSSSLVNFSQEPLDPGEQVATGCQWTADSEFIATGRGGVPANPNRPLATHRTWSDVRDLSEFRGETVEGVSVPVETPKPLVEATGWIVREDGVVELVADAGAPQSGNFGASECDPSARSN